MNRARQNNGTYEHTKISRRPLRCLASRVSFSRIRLPRYIPFSKTDTNAFRFVLPIELIHTAVSSLTIA